MPAVVAPAEERRRLLSRRIRLLVLATIAYNVLEAAVALTAGAAASSSALIGFGLDSVIEVASAVAIAWQFNGSDPAARERAALRVIACSFFALAGYVGVEAIWSLTGGQDARPSTVGLVLAALSLLIMPGLSYAERHAGRELGSRSAVADSKQTLLCTYLSAVLLVGLALNGLFGWSWADPIAALAIAAVAVREGRQAWRGQGCCGPATVGPGPAGGEAAACGCCAPTAGRLIVDSQAATAKPSTVIRPEILPPSRTASGIIEPTASGRLESRSIEQMFPWGVG